MPRKLTGRVECRRFKNGAVKWIARLGREYLGSFDSEPEARIAVDEALKDRKTHARTRSFASQFSAYMHECEQAQRTRRGNARQFCRNERTLAALYIHTAPFWLKDVDDVNRGEVRALIKSIAGRPARRWCKRTKAHVLIPGVKVGARTCELVRSRLTDFFDWVDELPSNPAKDVPIPNLRGVVRRAEGSDRKPHLHLDEIERLYALPGEVFTPLLRAVYALGIYAGLRGGEVVGLEWQNVVRLNGERPELQVRNSYDAATKTECSQREIPMLPQLVRELQAYVATLPARPVTGLVFPGLDGKVRVSGWAANWYARDLGPRKSGGRYTYPGLRELAEVRESILYRHLRHTFATHLLAGRLDGHEWPIGKVSRMLGHSSVTITEKHYLSTDADSLHAEAELAAKRNRKRNAENGHT